MPHSALQRHEHDHAEDEYLISTLMDGELGERETARMIETLNARGDWRTHWETYHIIGDILRQTPALESGLSRKVSQLLADEPTILAPRRRPAFTRLAMPAAASLAAVMLVIWGALNFTQDSTSPTLGAGQMAAATPGGQSVDARHNVAGYLVAHRDFSTGAAASLIANASFEVPAEPAR